jgi:hypothetical protein
MEKFKLPKDMWLRFGCFLSGHNYQILSECSEASKRDQKKITAALVIITLIWSIIGFIFSNKYLNFGVLGSIIGAAFMATLIVQIERQIILTHKLNNWAKFFRVLLGIIVATIGASIIDQYLFANDINDIAKKKVYSEAIIESKNDQIAYNNTFSLIDSAITINKDKIIQLENKISRLDKTVGAGGGGTVYDANGKVVSRQNGNRIANPEIEQLRNQQNSIIDRNNELERSKIKNEAEFNNAQKIKQEEISKRNPGFLKELNALIEYLFNFDPYPTALIFYLIWFFFFILIESLVLIIKSSDHENDYDKIVEYQQKIREQRLMILEDKRNAALGSDLNIDASNSLINSTPK